MTDSELVPWGKGEIEPREGSEIDTETKYLQSVEAMYMYAQPRTFCIMSQRVVPVLQG